MFLSSAMSVLEHVSEFQDTVVRRSTREIVADKVISLIASGTLRVGDLLPGERDLAAAFQVSRETVRGGMQILAARGFIEISHGARTKIINADVGPVMMGLLDAFADILINTFMPDFSAITLDVCVSLRASDFVRFCLTAFMIFWAAMSCRHDKGTV